MPELLYPVVCLLQIEHPSTEQIEKILLVYFLTKKEEFIRALFFINSFLPLWLPQTEYRLRESLLFP